jgi:hypothetical protein
MASLLQFTVDSMSPTIQYTPFGDTLATANVTAGWSPYFSTESGFVSAVGLVAGSGQSEHITSPTNDQPSITLNWTGEFSSALWLTLSSSCLSSTSIQIVGNAAGQVFWNGLIDNDEVPFNATDKARNILINLDGLPNTDHTVQLSVLPGSNLTTGFIVFEKAIITSPPPDDFSQYALFY